MIEINQISTNIDTPISKKQIAKKLGCLSSDILHFQISKESLDARKENIKFIYSVLAEVVDEEKYHSLPNVRPAIESKHVSPTLNSPVKYQPVVVGFGPSGMFTALELAKAGCRPIVLERGADVEQRLKDVQRFWEHGHLNPESNVQFGEGGAGTFSDGKLTTRIKDTRVQVVLDELIEAGADPAIRYQAHPHIGTDKLIDIVKSIREKIIRLGGEIHFNTQFTSFTTLDNNEKIIHSTTQDFKTDTLFLCLGHSAKDTITTLHNNDLTIEPQGFAVGVRIEHKQSFINQQQFGKWANHPRLGAAEYRLTHTASNGRGVYSFCMCPGGFVVPSSSLPDTLVTNGMSESSRNQKNANSAIVVQVPLSDFYKGSPLDGFKFQEALERNAFILGGGNYKAPIQLVQDYLNDVPSEKTSSVSPSYLLGTNPCNLRSLFSPAVNEALVEGLLAFDKKIKGFASNGAILTGVETRSSCPVRLSRNEQLESLSHASVYPVGEGAGYAGGIVSSAVDGIRCANTYVLKQNKS